MKKVLVLSDMQIYERNGRVDGLDMRTWEVVKQYAKSVRWDEIVIIGDFLDFNCISSHNKENLRSVERQRIAKDYKAGNKILDEIQEICKKVTLIEGNHEYRMTRLLDLYPALEGMTEVEKGLRLKERGMTYVKFWSKGELYKIGKATFGHGLYTNDGHAKKHVIQYGENFFYGHTHDVQSYSQTLRGKNKTIVGQSLGCLCKYDLPYMHGRPSKWMQAFGIFRIQKNGFFNYEVVRIFEHSFISPEGKLFKYKPKERFDGPDD